jgi:small subunit ribosomal protein S3
VGQKVNPIGFRLGIIKEPQARWYSNKKSFTQYLQEDIRVRRMIMGRLADAGVSRVDVERSANQMTVTIHAAKPGIVIGKSGVKVEELRKNLETMTGKKVRVTIQEIRQPELDAYLVARSVAEQLEKRVAFRRAMKQAIGRSMRFGAKGIRVQVSGRLGGSEMSRRESDRDGQVPLHTLRADIDFGLAEAHTTYGAIGVKVWVYKGEVLPAGPEPAAGTVAGRPGLRPLSREPLPGDGPVGREPEAAVATPLAEPAPEAPSTEAELPAPPAAPAPASAEPTESVEAEAVAVPEPPMPRAEASATTVETEPAEAAAKKPRASSSGRARRSTTTARQAEAAAAPTEPEPAPAKKPRASRKKTDAPKEPTGETASGAETEES